MKKSIYLNIRHIHEQINLITTKLGNPPDLKVREIILCVGQNQMRKGWVLYCSSLVNEERIANEVIQPLSTLPHVHTANDGLEIFHRVQNVITSLQIEEVHDLDEQVSSPRVCFIIYPI